MKRYCDPSVCPSVCLSPGRAAALGYWHAGCLQPSKVRTADLSADGRRSTASRTAIGGGISSRVTLRVHLYLQHAGGGNASRHLRQRNSAGFETMVFHPANCPSELGPFPAFLPLHVNRRESYQLQHCFNDNILYYEDIV